MAKPSPQETGGGSTPEQLFAQLRGGGAPASKAEPPSPSALPAEELNADTVLSLTGDVAGRPVADKYLLVPLKAGPGGREALYTCNDAGRACWEAIDGQRSLGAIAESVASDFEGASASQVLADLLAFAGDLVSVGAAKPKRG